MLTSEQQIRFKEKLNEIKEQSGMSFREFGEATMLGSKMNTHDVLKGRRNVTLEHIKKVEDAFGLELYNEAEETAKAKTYKTKSDIQKLNAVKDKSKKKAAALKSKQTKKANKIKYPVDEEFELGNEDDFSLDEFKLEEIEFSL